MIENTGRWIAGTLVSLLLAFAGLVVLLWQIGLFNLSKTDPGAQAFAAVLALLGGIFASMLTFVGVLLKLSMDARTLEMKREADARNAQLQQEAIDRQKEAEERRKIDSCVQSLGLLSTPSGNEPSQNQKAAALMALTDLGQMEFAFALLEQMWLAGELAPSSAVWFVNKGLEDADEGIQLWAARILNEHAHELKNPTDGSYPVWPSCLSADWKPDLNQHAREQLFRALLRCLVSQPFEVWSGDVLNHMIVSLHRIWASDQNKLIKNGAMLTLDVILKFDPGTNNISTPDGPLNKSKVREEVNREARLSDQHVEEYRTSVGFRHLVEELEAQWKQPPERVASSVTVPEAG